MNRIEFSTYSGPSDLDPISRAVSSNWRDVGPDSQIHVGNLAWRLAGFDLKKSSDDIGIWLAEDGEIISFTALYDMFPLDLFIRTHVEAREVVLAAMLDWAEARWRTRQDQGTPQAKLRIGCFATDKLRLSTLQARGYAMADKTYLRLTCPVTGHSVPELPAGLHLSPLSPEARGGQVIRLHNELFPMSPIDEDKLGRIVASRWYRDDLSLVVEHPTQGIVGFVFGWYDQDCQTLEFEPVGCHPDWRRRGVASTLLLSSMARARESGAVRASVTAPGENDGTIAFYRAVGFADHAKEHELVKHMA